MNADPRTVPAIARAIDTLLEPGTVEVAGRVGFGARYTVRRVGRWLAEVEYLGATLCFRLEVA